MQKKDYIKLYLLQDKVLKNLVTLNLPFYLTGGTALGRFYLNHRKSEDLDFFVNQDSHFKNHVKIIFENLKKKFTIDTGLSFIDSDFMRIIIIDDELSMKVEFVNDVAYYAGKPLPYDYGLIDNVRNILANKLTAIIGRDEAKDIFDLIYISLHYRFNWYELFLDAKEKELINELELAQRIDEFPVDWLNNVDWISENFQIDSFKECLKTITADFLLTKDNSLAPSGIDINQAKPLLSL